MAPVDDGTRAALRKLAVPAAVFLVVLVSRLPFVTHELWAWDSVLYARALEQGFHVDFDLAGQRPHPPGYILYVAAAATARLFFTNSNDALVAISVLASAAAAMVVFLVARRFASTGPALFVTIGYATNPLVWTHGEIAYPYAVLGLLSVTLAGLFWRARDGHASEPLLASLAFGLLAGFRQDLLMLAAGLWLWLVWRFPWRTRLAAAALVAIGTLPWLYVSASLSGGLARYLMAVIRQTNSVRPSFTSATDGLLPLERNANLVIAALGWGLGVFAIVLVILGLATVVLRRARLTRHEVLFFATWLTPGLVFYSAIHIGEWGYVLSVLPGFYVLCAALIARHRAILPRLPSRLGLAAAVVLLLPGFFSFSTGSGQFSARALARHDQAALTKVAFVRNHFPPDRTIVLATNDYLIAQRALPEYTVCLYEPERRIATPIKRLPPGTTIVIFEEGLTLKRAPLTRVHTGVDDIAISYVTIEQSSAIELYGNGYAVREAR